MLRFRVVSLHADFCPPSFRWVLAPTELRDRLPPRDRSNSIVRLVLTEAVQGLIDRRLRSFSLSVLNDLELGQAPLDPGLFPGVPGGVLVHEGFRDAHSATAPSILAQVKNLISTKGATSVITVSPSRWCFDRVTKSKRIMIVFRSDIHSGALSLSLTQCTSG